MKNFLVYFFFTIYSYSLCRNSHHRSVMGASFDQTSGSFVDRGIVCRLTGTSFPGLLDKNRRRAEGLWLIRVAWEGYESGKKKAITPNRVIYKCILRVEYWKFDLILFSLLSHVYVCVSILFLAVFSRIVDVRRRPFGRRKAKREREKLAKDIGARRKEEWLNGGRLMRLLPR